MGDVGTGLYVSPEVIPIYRDMLGLATIITPNQFELESVLRSFVALTSRILSSIKVSSFHDLKLSLDLLHDSVPNVALSSIELPDAMIAQLDLPPPPDAYSALASTAPASTSKLICVASSRTETYAYAVPAIDGYFSGVGDLFSALVIAHYSESLPEAVSRALYGVQQILLRTHIASPAGSDEERKLGKAAMMRSRELRIVQEQAVISESNIWPGKEIDWSELA